jgi:2'-phosphotransferase
MSARPLDAKETIVLSKLLSKVLRHDALKMGFKMGSDGRVSVDELLRHQKFRRFTLTNIRDVVDGCDKKRFELSESEDGALMIRASQGHTIDSIADSELLTEVLDASEVPVCIHGTYKAFLPLILENGLNKMKRNHIHMAVGLPGADEVISGMRKSCQVILYINVAAAMAAGVKFYRSSNGVILTAGVDGSGILPAEFIQEVVELSR